MEQTHVDRLQLMMDRESPYVAMYRSMKEKMSEMPPETKMVIAETEGHDMRRYNKPRQLEPAVVFFAAKTVRRQQTETLQSGRETRTQKSIVFPTNVNMWIHWHTHCCSLVASLVGTRN